MFNRVFLFVISIVSILWISYVGYDLLDQRDKITPLNIFNAQDDEILIVNRSEEVDLLQLPFEPNAAMQPLVTQLLSSAYSGERIYISGKRPVIIIELPAFWNNTKITRFFSTKGIQSTVTGSGTIRLENGITGKFQRNYLLLSTGEVAHNRETSEWPVWDKKASATIIELNKPLKSTDIYFKADGTISYQTKYNRDIQSRKIDDQDIFAEMLPNKLTNYHFIERQFAESTNMLAENSPLFQWSETGFVFFNYQGNPCIVSDFIGGQDPFTVIGERNGTSDTVQIVSGSRIRNIKLTKSFPKNLSSGFYMMYLGDKVVISENKESCEKIVADYQLGKTVALTAEIKSRIYSKLPRKVSERFVSGNLSYTKSAYRNILIKTQINPKLAAEEVKTDPKAEETEQNWTQAFDGDILSLMGRGKQQFIWTNSGKLISVSNKKRRWQQDFDGKLNGDPQIIDLLDNGQQQLLFNTASHIYLVNMNGENHEGFPVKLDEEASNTVSYYRWKGVGNFIIVDKKNQLVHLDNRGRELSSIKLNVSNCKNPVEVFNQKGNLIAVVSGDNQTQTVNLLRNRVVKTHGAIPDKSIAVKNADGPNYYAFENGELQRQDYQGNKITLANYPNPELFRLIEGENFKYIAFNSYNKIHVLNERGIKLFQFDVPFRELASFDVITLQNGKTYVAMIDGLENNLYLYDNTGKCYTEKPLEGKGKVFLSEKGNGNLVITTSGNGFIVQYFDVLKRKQQ